MQLPFIRKTIKLSQRFFQSLTAILLILLLSAGSCRKKHQPQRLKALWIHDAYASIRGGEFPRIKAVSWWHENWEGTQLRIDSSPEVTEAYRQAVSDTFWQTQPVFANEKLLPPASGCYHAAFPDFGGPEDMVSADSVRHFERLAGKNITWAYFSDNWYDQIGFPWDAVQEIHRAGRVPFIRMMAREDIADYEPDTLYTMQNIIDGRFDAELLQWFRDAAATGYPMLIEFGTEVNGAWFPWNGTYHGGGETTGYGDPSFPDGPERFRDAFRHIVLLSRQAGANNLTWFFHLDAYGEPDEPWNDFENYYPGDAYVDWIGISVYGPMTPSDDWETFRYRLSQVYDRVCRMTTKPLAVVETGVTEYGFAGEE